MTTQLSRRMVGLFCLRCSSTSHGPVRPVLSLAPTAATENQSSVTTQQRCVQRVVSKSLRLSVEDVSASHSESLNHEASPAITSQLDILHYSIRVAESSLQSGDDIADHYVFKKAYQKYFGMKPEIDLSRLSSNSNKQSEQPVSCTIRLADENRTKIFIHWLPSYLSKAAICKIVELITSCENFTYYIYNVGSSSKILIHSKASTAVIPKYIELLNEDSENLSVLEISVKNKK